MIRTLSAQMKPQKIPRNCPSGKEKSKLANLSPRCYLPLIYYPAVVHDQIGVQEIGHGAGVVGHNADLGSEAQILDLAR